jgi:hypothetical protein
VNRGQQHPQLDDASTPWELSRQVEQIAAEYNTVLAGVRSGRWTSCCAT